MSAKKKPKEPTDRQYRAATLRVAEAYVSWHTCRLCLLPTVAGYVCYHCKGDDSVMEDDRAD